MLKIASLIVANTSRQFESTQFYLRVNLMSITHGSVTVRHRLPELGVMPECTEVFQWCYVWSKVHGFGSNFPFWELRALAFPGLFDR